MSQYSRFIEVNLNLVHFDPTDEERCATIDCTTLKDKNIKFVCEEDGVMWVEYTPFTGRIYEFDREEIDQLFQAAETSWNASNDLFMETLDVTPEIGAYYGMRAIEDLGYLQQFYDWTVSPERTIQQKMYFSHKITWRRDDVVLVECLKSIGFEDQKIDDVFEMAVNY